MTGWLAVDLQAALRSASVSPWARQSGQSLRCDGGGQAHQHAALVAPHQAGVADNIRSEDRRQFALLTGHGKFPRLLHQIVEGPNRPVPTLWVLRCARHGRAPDGRRRRE